MEPNIEKCLHIREWWDSLVSKAREFARHSPNRNTMSKLQEWRSHQMPEKLHERDCNHSIWEVAHSAQARRRSRMVGDAAKNHWFVCNNGIAHSSQPLVYDPYGAMVAAMGGDESLAHFNYLWEHEADKNQKGNELNDFWRGFDYIAKLPDEKIGRYEEVEGCAGTIMEPPFIEKNERDLAYASALQLLAEKPESEATAADEIDKIQFASIAATQCPIQKQVPQCEICEAITPSLLMIPETKEVLKVPESKEVLRAPESKGVLRIPEWRLLRMALDPTTSVSVLDELSKHPLNDVRIAIAGNPKTSADTIEHLIKDPVPDVRIALAQNPHTKAEVLEKLVIDEDANVAYVACEAWCNRK